MSSMNATDATALIGYDTSEDMGNLSVLCTDCGRPEDEAAVYAGEEWGEYMDSHHCAQCGRDLSLDGLVLIAEDAR